MKIAYEIRGQRRAARARARARVRPRRLGPAARPARGALQRRAARQPRRRRERRAAGPVLGRADGRRRPRGARRLRPRDDASVRRLARRLHRAGARARPRPSASRSSCSARPRSAARKRTRCRSQTQAVFAKYPTMEREAALRMFVENSLGERGVRELPELVEEIYAYRLEHAPTTEAWVAQATAGATFVDDDRVGSIDKPTLVVHGRRRHRRRPAQRRAPRRADPERARRDRPGSRPPARLGGFGGRRRADDRVPAAVIDRIVIDRARNTPRRVAIDYRRSPRHLRRARRRRGALRRRVRGGRADARRPRGDAHRQHARARDGHVRVRAARPDPAAALVAARRGRARVPARRRRAVALPRRGRVPELADATGHAWQPLELPRAGRGAGRRRAARRRACC